MNKKETGELSAEDRELLEKYATRSHNGGWYVSGSPYPHDERAALAVIKSCLRLDVTVTDRLTAEAWFRVIDRLITLENRVAEMREQAPTGDPYGIWMETEPIRGSGEQGK